MSDRDQEMLHAKVLGVVKRIEAVDEAVGLLEAHEGETLAEVRDVDGQEGVDRVIAARALLDLDPLDAEHGEDETGDVAEGLDEKRDEEPEALFLDDPIEIRVEGRFSFHSGQWEVTDAVAVICTGGPHIEARTTGTGNLRVSGWWGGSKVEGMHCDSERACMALEQIEASVEQSTEENVRFF